MKPSYFPVLKGVVNAVGFFFPTSVMPVNQCRRRILSLWETGSRVYRFETGYVFFLAEKRDVETVSSPGTPVIETKGSFATIELTEEQAAFYRADNMTVLLVIEGDIQTCPLTEDHRKDPSSWLDISDYSQVEEIHPLGELPPPPELSVKPINKETKDILGESIPDASPKKDRILKRIEKIKRKQEASDSKSGKQTLAYRRSVFGFPASLLRWVTAFAFNGSGRPSSTQTTQKSVPPVQKKPQGPGFMSTLFSGFMSKSGLWRLFAEKQAKYLSKMMRMFEKGDYHNALKYGISLSSVADIEKTTAPWRMPAPRANLDISQGNPNYSSSMITDHGTHNYLKLLYERAFKALDREGKIEEAAFVLADLLRDSERAVSYLEKHKKLNEAAQLAESRELPPGLIVRQWFLCGKVDRAVSIAKKTHAFSDAVLHLERTHRNESRMLRMLWAKFLEQSGDYEKAVNVIWPVEEARELAEQWIHITIEAGGAAAARMLARSLSLFSETHDMEKLQTTRAHIKTLLVGSSDNIAADRAVFAKELIKQSKNFQAGTIARQTLRTLINDRACNKNGWTKQDFKALIDFSEDAPIKNEFQKLNKDQLFTPSPNSLAARTKPLIYEFSDSGTHAIHDVCMINHDRFLTAHGEGGVRMINNQGKVLAHFNIPAHVLVLSDNGNRAIAIARRGDVFRLSQINMNEKKATYWCETPLDLYAKTFDGARWFVVTGSTLSAIDVHSTSFKASWHVTDLPGYTFSLSRSPEKISILMDTVDDTECWTYETTGPIVLRDRYYMGSQSETCITSAVNPSGQVALFDMDEEHQSIIYTLKNKGKQTLKVPLSTMGGVIGIPDFSENWLSMPSGDSETVSLNFIHPGYGQTKLILKFIKTNKITIKCNTDTAVISDSNGRIIAVDLNTGALLHDIRL